jgi:hypothetical protein
MSLRDSGFPEDLSDYDIIFKSPVLGDCVIDQAEWAESLLLARANADRGETERTTQIRAAHIAGFKLCASPEFSHETAKDWPRA